MTRHRALPRLRSGGPAGRGFTLLEVMVALGILAASLVAISDVVGGALRNQVRARNLEMATLLAKGKMVALQDHYEWKGFAASDESDDGSFDDEGHPEVKWRVDVTAPKGTIDADSMLRSLTGTDLQGLLGQASQQQGSSLQQLQASQLAPFQAQLQALLQPTLARLAENVKKGLREVRLTVSWPENGRSESFEVKTHMLVLAPGETAPIAPTATAPTPPAGTTPTAPGGTTPTAPGGTAR